MNSGVIFIAGTYGVGKSTLGQKLSAVSAIPFYSAGDLISAVNGEIYGANKAVQDKYQNQLLLINAVNHKLQTEPNILLAGHFCIFNQFNHVEILPEYVFNSLHIERILLLEADAERIIANLETRDSKKYVQSEIEKLKNVEHMQAIKVADKLNIPLHIYKMKFDLSDVDETLSVLQGGQD